MDEASIESDSCWMRPPSVDNSHTVFYSFFPLSLFQMSNIRHKLENDDDLVRENEDRPVRPVMLPAHSSK